MVFMSLYEFLLFRNAIVILLFCREKYCKPLCYDEASSFEEGVGMFDFPGGQVAAFCITFAVGVAGYFIFKLFRVPSPAMLGAMAATGALSIAGLYPFFDTRPVSFIASVTIGVMIGRLVDRTLIGRMANMAKPVVIQTAGMIALSLFCGISMHLISGIDLTTSLISATTGGVTEMIIFGMAVDADVSVIAFVQLFRLIFFVALIPYLGFIAEKITSTPQVRHDKIGCSEDISVKFFCKSNYLIMIILAFAAGGLAHRLGIPAGAMLGAMFTGGGMAMFLGKRYNFDSRLRFIALICIGLVTGARITPQFIEQLGSLLIPTVIVTLIMLIGCFLMALLLHKTSSLSLTTCLLCVTPAGMNQVVPLSEDLGADPLAASVFHTARFSCIVIFYPWLIMPFIA